ncbi:MAG: dihydrodipicolinate synthase family protein [Acidobacteria bacterium]|nr:dihydrodipicolinate synthase family protein [Acidobacteriota bacterium]
MTRREWLTLLGGAAVARASTPKPMRGAFIIMATPFTATQAVDFEDLANEAVFLDRCGVHGMVWPQLASEYMKLTKDERLHGMETLARAAKGRKPALVLGVQGANIEAALEYVRHAEKLSPDALIAIPPTEAASLDDFRRYYRALAQATRRPLFVQTTGGARNIVPEVSFLVELAKEFPHCGYIKEEYNPVIPRMTELAASRPAIRGVFSGAAGRGMMYEMRLGFDGTMPGAPYADLYARVWDLYQAGQREKAREVFSGLMLMVNLEQQVPGTRQYIMKKRGVFKTTVSRREEVQYSPEAIQEIEFNWAALKPYLRV